MQKFKVSFYLKVSKAKSTSSNGNDDTKCPIYLRVYVNGKTTMKATGHEVEPKFWDAKKQVIKSNHRDAMILNVDLLNKISEVRKFMIVQQISGNEISVASAKKSLQPGRLPKER